MVGSKASSRQSQRRDRPGQEIHQASAQHKRVISHPDRVDHFRHRKTPEVQQDISQTYEDANMLASIYEGSSAGVPEKLFNKANNKPHKDSHHKSQSVAIFDYQPQQLQYKGD